MATPPPAWSDLAGQRAAATGGQHVDTDDESVRSSVSTHSSVLVDMGKVKDDFSRDG